jgi:hypothetical protein
MFRLLGEDVVHLTLFRKQDKMFWLLGDIRSTMTTVAEERQDVLVPVLTGKAIDIPAPGWRCDLLDNITEYDKMFRLPGDHCPMQWLGKMFLLLSRDVINRTAVPELKT